VSEEEHKDFSEQEVQQRFEAIGKTMVEPGLYAEAVEAYKELIREFPGSRWAANAYLAIAQCYHAMGQDEDELATLEDILKQFPDHVVAKRAQGAVTALRDRRYGEGPAGADLHGAVRRLTRQVERTREAQRRRAWIGAISWVVLLVVIWGAIRVSARAPVAPLNDLNKRVTALESAVQALSGAAMPAPSSERPSAGAPAVTVIPVQPDIEAKPEPKPTQVKPSAPTVVKPAAPPVKPALPTAKPSAPTLMPPRPAPKPARAQPKPARRPAKPVPAIKPAAAVTATKTYTVKEGDSLWTMAHSQLGDARRVGEIARLNGLQAPYKIKVGQKLRLPARR